MTEVNLWEVKQMVQDAADLLERAESMLCENGDAAEHWAAYGATIDAIAGVARSARKLLPFHPEIEEAIRGEAEENDRLSDLADAASY